MKIAKLTMLAASAAMMTALPSAPVQAQSNPFLGQIMMNGYTFCPRGWANTDGQLLAISSNTALFSLLGTTYGGDGRTTFGLPDLRGRSPVHTGNGPGLSSRPMGQRFGAETATLTVATMPSHNHTGTIAINNTAPADSGNPTNNHFARSGTLIYEDTQGSTPGATMAANTLAINNNGGNQAFSIQDPHQVVRFCIATQGIYPSRS